MISNWLKQIPLIRNLRRSDREICIGDLPIRVPHSHQIDRYQQRWKRYDVALAEIARVVQTKYPDLTAVDVGANVGDSAALIRKHCNVPVLCVEGNDEFLPFLRENAKRIGADIELAECFVADDHSHIDPARINTARGTASMARAINCDPVSNAIATRSLESIVQEHTRFTQSKLLKIDTDGFDFPIICNSFNFLADARPIVFFEYDMEGSDDALQQSFRAVEILFETGYERHLVYDNFGNFLIQVDSPHRFMELNAFLKSNRRNGIATYYLDVCSFHTEDNDLCDQIRQIEIAAVAADCSSNEYGYEFDRPNLNRNSQETGCSDSPAVSITTGK